MGRRLGVTDSFGNNLKNDVVLFRFQLAVWEVNPVLGHLTIPNVEIDYQPQGQ